MEVCCVACLPAIAFLMSVISSEESWHTSPLPPRPLILERWNWFSRTTHRVHKIKAKFTVWPCIFLTPFSDLHHSLTDTIVLFINAESKNELYLPQCDKKVMMFMFSPFSHMAPMYQKSFHKTRLMTYEVSPLLFILCDYEYSFRSFKFNECYFIFIMH